MFVSVFDMFSVGIGPSSSHTVGPMRAGRLFALSLKDKVLISFVHRIQVDLYGSLALTGLGHGTDRGSVWGLVGEEPETIETSLAPALFEEICNSKKLPLLKEKTIPFNYHRDILFHKNHVLPFHSNGIRFTAFDVNDEEILSKIYYSIGGGFIVSHDEVNELPKKNKSQIYPIQFNSCDELQKICKAKNITFAEAMLLNERVHADDEEIERKLLYIWDTMKACIEKGIVTEGILPGGLNLQRRAPILYAQLKKSKGEDPAAVLDWVSLWALAVNEENAAWGRVVTAPTNGASGLIPAVIQYYLTFVPNASKEGICIFLLTAGLIGGLYKKGASLSGAEMGCQGEVGVACSMAAGGLAAVMGGTSEQVEIAAEIGMEHNLGLTCDPIKGLVQIPCIERNAIGAVKAINAARLAISCSENHKVSLDQVIETMRQTGRDMKTIYKETSLGGLAVNVVEC